MLEARYLSEPSELRLTAVLTDWKAAFPDAGIFALLPEAEKERVKPLQSIARTLELPLMGAIFPALLSSNGFQTAGITLLRIDPCPPWILVDQLSDGEGVTRIQRIAELVNSRLNEPQAETSPTLFLIFDALLPNIGTLLESVYQGLRHRVHYAGVNAGSETFQSVPCLFDRESLIQDGCIAMLFRAMPEFIVEHKYPVSKALFRATSTTGNRIDQIDGKPAMVVYQELLHSEFGVTLTPDNFYQYAVHYPFGLATALDVLVRIPVALTDNGAIYCVGEIPPCSILKLLRAPKLEESQCVGAIISKLGTRDAPLVTFYCAGRRMHFGADAEIELRQLVASSGSQDLFGALSLGEIGMDSEMGFPEFHNAALVCVR